MAPTYDVTVIGAGIIGLATAMKLAESYPSLRLLVVEKEAEIGRHQTGHNSGVIHSGLYYRPGSIKARTCVAGRKALLDFCDRHDVPYELCGKVVVATCDAELPRLDELYRRALANGLQGVAMIGPERLRELEPHARGVRALHVPETGIIDYSRVAAGYADRLRRLGGDIRTSHRVLDLIETRSGIVLQTPAGDYLTRKLINCGGLHSDVVARMMRANGDGSPGHRIVPFRGEYYRLAPAREFLVRNLIYPVPDPAFPFLGVHFTRMIRGGVEAGPNAVMAFAREGYRIYNVDRRDLWRMVSFKGFWAMAAKYWRTGCAELYRSLSKPAFVAALRRLVPDIAAEDLVPGGAGVRAQAVSPSGALVDDFVIDERPNAIHVVNAPSPGATASLAIAETITNMAGRRFGLTR